MLGAHYPTLAVARALTRKGIRVMAVASSRHDHACYSRFVSDLVVAPNPTNRGDELLKVLMETERDWDGALLVPALDEYVIFVSQNRAELGRRFVFAVPSREVVERINHKRLLYQAAREAGIPVPEFILPDSAAALDEWRDSAHYPCILKPDESHKFRGVYDVKALVAHDYRELTEQFADTQRHRLDVMVSEIIPGDDSTIFTYRCYIDSRGEVLAELCTQKLRQYPTGFGQGSVQRTVPMIPELRDQGLTLLRRLDYWGQAYVEFRLDHRDERYKLMEINTRPGVCEWLVVSAGVNMPYLAYRDLVEDVREPLQGYDTDLHWIHNHWEFVHLIRFLKAGHLDLREFFAPYGKKRVYAVPFFDDPVGFVRDMLDHIGVASRRIGQRSAL